MDAVDNIRRCWGAEKQKTSEERGLLAECEHTADYCSPGAHAHATSENIERKSIRGSRYAQTPGGKGGAAFDGNTSNAPVVTNVR